MSIYDIWFNVDQIWISESSHSWGRWDGWDVRIDRMYRMRNIRIHVGWMEWDDSDIQIWSTLNHMIPTCQYMTFVIPTHGWTKAPAGIFAGLILTLGIAFVYYDNFVTFGLILDLLVRCRGHWTNNSLECFVPEKQLGSLSPWIQHFLRESGSPDGSWGKALWIGSDIQFQFIGNEIWPNMTNDNHI